MMEESLESIYHHVCELPLCLIKFCYALFCVHAIESNHNNTASEWSRCHSM